jgi:ABC-2 type transport system permease protein
MTSFTGTWRLVRLGIRRDRVNLLVWLVGLGVLAFGSVSAVAGVYPTEADRVIGATFTAGNRLSRAFDGPASGTHIGAMTMVETYTVLAVLAGIMSILAVTRLTRQDEETGRAELVGSAVVGRRARLAAALLVVLGLNVGLAGVTTLALLAQDLPLEGSLAAAAALGAAGMSFAAIAAITAQLVDSQRAATGLASAVLGGAFLLRAVGDAAGSIVGETFLVSAWPSWLSPIGWGSQVRPYSQNQWDVFVIFGVFVLGLALAAFAIGDRRDVGAGVFRTRPGPPAAEGSLASPTRLVWRLQRGTLAAWAAGALILGVAWASLGDGADEIIGLSDEIEAMFRSMVGEGELVDAYVAFVMSFTAIVIAAAMVQALLRTRTEESTGRIEPLLATSLGRHRWLGATVLVAGGAAVAIVAVVGLASALVFGVMTEDVAGGIASFGGATLAQIPALIAIGGFVVAATGLLPRWAAGLAWGALAASFVMGQLGAILDLPQTVLNLSPFTHVPGVPATGFELLPIAALTATGLVLGAIGFGAFRRRDLQL